MRTLPKFIYKTENEHIKLKNEFADILKVNLNIFEDVPIPTEFGDMTIDDYIIFMLKPWKWGGEIEIYTSQLLYNINVCAYNSFLNFYGVICKIII